MESNMHLLKVHMQTVDTYDIPAITMREVMMNRYQLKALIGREPTKDKKDRSFKVHVNSMGMPVYWTKRTV